MQFYTDFSNLILNILNSEVLGVNTFEFLAIILFALISLIVRGMFAVFITSKIKKFVNKTGNKIDDKLFDVLIPPFKLLPIVLVFLIITLYFDIQSTLGVYLQKINTTLSTILIFWLIHQSLILFANIFYKLEKLLSKALVLWILKSLKYLVILLALVAVLDVWGIKIGPVIAGLGLFGVAVALGAQDLFKNLISGIMILLEKRFNIGDVINVPGHSEGTVEHIGFRSTLIRQFDSTPMSLPNYLFAESPILNYSKRNFRRINWIIGLEYNTTIDDLKNITKLIKSFITSNPLSFKLDDNHKCFVRLEQFNDSSITNTKEWDKFLKIKEDLALNIKSIVELNNASFAYPSRSIYIEKNDIKV